MDTSDWLSAVAERVGMDNRRVGEIADKYNIKASPLIPAPKRLQIKKLEFSGEKYEVEQPGEFKFQWESSGSGLWWVLTDQNFKGKTSFFEVVRWLLRGSPSSKLQPDVKRWIKKARLDFLLGGIDYRVEVLAGDNFRGQLQRLSKGSFCPIASFVSESDFAQTMSRLMMSELSLESIDIHQKGSVVTHEWPLLAGAMFVSTNYSKLLGDSKLPAAPVKLLQMYLGLPWVSTYSTASSVEKVLKSEKDRNAANDSASKKKIDDLKVVIKNTRNVIAGLPKSEELVNAYGVLDQELQKLLKEKRSCVRLIAELREEKTRFHAEVLADRKEYQAALDAQAAGEIFRKLTPTVCPRCQRTISLQHKEEELKTGECCLCHEIFDDSEDSSELVNSIRMRLAASEKGFSKISKQLQGAEKQELVLIGQIKEVEEKTTKLGFESKKIANRRVHEIKLTQLEAELNLLLKDEGKQPNNVLLEWKVVKAIAQEVKNRYATLQMDLLDDISKQIVLYAKRFGMDQIVSAKLQPGAQLSFSKGGAQASYSSATAGEKLRLKLATLLAMLKVSEDRGIGRHPGLIMIDSPAAQEVAPDDLDQILSGIKGIVDELPHLQVFIASRATSVVLGHAEESRWKRAYGDNFLW